MSGPIKEMVLVGLMIAASGSLFGRSPITFEERVRAQEAIERVYYSHRIWPKENPGPKPPFEKMVSKYAIEARVSDYLRKCDALDRLWRRPISHDQLQAEMDRMARESRDPALLLEIFAALDNDALLIAECFAKPLLAGRLALNAYASDPENFAEARRLAEHLRDCASKVSDWSEIGGSYGRWAVYPAGEDSPAARASGAVDPAPLPLAPAEFGRLLVSAAGDEDAVTMQEDDRGFTIRRFLKAGRSSIELEAITVAKRPFLDWWREKAPAFSAAGPDRDWARPPAVRVPEVDENSCNTWDYGISGMPGGRYGHSAIWTGTEMIVWGGYWHDGIYHFESTGGRYNPATDTWAPVSLEDAPSARYLHTAVWTGTEMVIWGGALYTGTNYCDAQGGRYSPDTDSWRPTSTAQGCPKGRLRHTAIWTGTVMIVWGGVDSTDVMDTGGVYNPSSDSWAPTPVLDETPSPRGWHTAVWTGSEMIIWGGYDRKIAVDTGGRFSPQSGSWIATSSGAGVPDGRYYHTAIWTGSEMIVWGGDGFSSYEGIVGSSYNPAGDSWTPLNCPLSYCPNGGQHTAVWTGRQMLVFGGISSEGWPGNEGFCYEPETECWAPTSTANGVPEPRYGHSAIWTGKEMIVWGGIGENLDSSSYSWLSSGGRYDPALDTWVRTAQGGNAPSPRTAHTAIWTGVEMIVWGGIGDGVPIVNYAASGGKYNPDTNSWLPTSIDGGTPLGRCGHTAVWTGTEMVIWGGIYYNGSYHIENSGGRYNPASDNWATTSAGENVPRSRSGHTAVWTGSEMVIWGGGMDQTGGRYDPLADSWKATSTNGDVPSARSGHTALWTGAEMVLWGGCDQINGPKLATGGRYNPDLDHWTATSVGSETPAPRSGHTAVWTGSEMIVWGGEGENDYRLNTGGRYSPTSDTWSPTSSGADCPSKRYVHAAIWTGSEMVLWGGRDEDDLTNTGGVYAPGTDSWSPTPLTSGVPLPRGGHTAVWADGAMLVWGGSNDYGELLENGGALCLSPSSPRPDIAIDCDPRSFTLVQGESAGGTCTITSLAGFRGTATITCTSGLYDIKLLFSATSIHLVPGGSAKIPFTLVVGSKAVPMKGPIEIAVASPTFTRTVSLDLTVLYDCRLTCDSVRTSSAAGPVPLWVGFYPEVSLPGCYETVTYDWDFGDGSAHESSYLADHRYETQGSFTWTFTVSTGGKSCTASGVIRVDPPLLGVEIKTEPVPGKDRLSAIFTGTILDGTPPYRCEWDFGDGAATSQECAVEHAYSSPGRYTFTFKAWDSEGRYGSKSKSSIFSNCALACSPSAEPDSGVQPLTVNFLPNVTSAGCVDAISYYWYLGEGNTCEEPSPTRTYSQAGTYSWFLTVMADDQVANGSGAVTVEQTPCKISCSGGGIPDPDGIPLKVLFSSTADLADCSDSPIYRWDFGDQTTSAEANPVHFYRWHGSYRWSLSVSANGAKCFASGSVVVPEPDCQIGCTATVSPDSGTTSDLFTFTSDATVTNCASEPELRWDFGDGWVSTQPNLTHRYIKDELYTWRLTICSGQDRCERTGTIVVGTPPCRISGTASASPRSGTAPLTVAFTAEVDPQFCSGPPAFLWDFGDGATSGEQNPVHTYTTPGSMAWKLTVSVDGLTLKKQGYISISTPPCSAELAATADPATGAAPLSVNFNAEATISNCGGQPAYHWVFGDGGRSNEQNPRHVYTSPGSFQWKATLYVESKIIEQGGTVVVTESTVPPGDCDGDGTVSIGEVQKVINMFLGAVPPECGVDCDGDGTVSIGELQKVINAFLGSASAC